VAGWRAQVVLFQPLCDACGLSAGANVGDRVVYAQHDVQPLYKQFDGELDPDGAVSLLLVTTFALRRL
jgi:hypothetical protein